MRTVGIRVMVWITKIRNHEQATDNISNNRRNTTPRPHLPETNDDRTNRMQRNSANAHPHELKRPMQLISGEHKYEEEKIKITNTQHTYRDKQKNQAKRKKAHTNPHIELDHTRTQIHTHKLMAHNKEKKKTSLWCVVYVSSHLFLFFYFVMLVRSCIRS